MCALSDFAGVEIDIGGICKAHFGDNKVAEGFIQRDGTTYVDGWGCIDFSFEGTGSIFVKVGPFPSREAFVSHVDGASYGMFLREGSKAMVEVIVMTSP
jgi:hypothetical protein